MPDTKWTPGPWTWNGYCVIDQTNNVIAIEGIAQPHGYVPQGDVSYANARLFSAAPDLYEALEAAQEELRLLRMKDTGTVYDPTLRGRISAVLAKARGENA